MSHTSLPILRHLLGPARPVLVPLSGRARGELIGFRPMAVLCDAEHAFKPEMAANRPAPILHASTAPALSAPPAAPMAATPGHFRFFRGFSAAALTPAPRLPNRSRSSGRLVLSGTFSEVCGELERLVAHEERYLHAG